MEFIGGNDGGAGVYGTPGNVSMPLYCGGDYWFYFTEIDLSTADISITRCYFELGLVGPDFSGLNENSTVFLADNVMTNNALSGIYLGTFVGTKCIVKNNVFKNSSWADLYIDDYDFGIFPDLTSTKRAKFTITGNEFESAPGAISMYLRDYLIVTYPDNQLLPQLFDIMGNSINTQEGGIGIQCLNSTDAKIWNNKFSGTGSMGVLVEGDEASSTYAENVKIMGNNFMNAAYADATVSLGTYSKNCMVVGVATDNIVDLGVNNKIIGVKAQKKGPHHSGMQGHLKSMQENMMKMRPSKP